MVTYESLTVLFQAGLFIIALITLIIYIVTSVKK